MKHVNNAIVGALVIGVIAFAFEVSQLATTLSLLFIAFYVIHKRWGLFNALVLSGIPIIVNVVDSFPGQQTTFRHFMAALYALCLIILISRQA